MSRSDGRYVDSWRCLNCHKLHRREHEARECDCLKPEPVRLTSAWQCDKCEHLNERHAYNCDHCGLNFYTGEVCR
jgi:hypothetical protein